jgi:hypothetical protein
LQQRKIQLFFSQLSLYYFSDNKYYMKLKEFATVKPLTPQQARLDALKTQRDNVSRALDGERKRQKVTKAQQNLRNVLSA